MPRLPIFAALGAVIALTSQPLLAQSVRNFDNVGRAEVRGMAALTIPLGGSRQDVQSAPRLDFAMETSRIGDDDFARPLRATTKWDGRINVRRTALSFTLEQNPTMMLNGTPVATYGPTLGAGDDQESNGGGNTVLYVVGGVLLLGVISTVAIVTDVRDAGSDLIGPAD